MHVLDIGCGMGDVTMVATQLVGLTRKSVPIEQVLASIETQSTLQV
jgi:cyclopropane fatty-acyl-phospholipid synthase-like methyltransferase